MEWSAQRKRLLVWAALGLVAVGVAVLVALGLSGKGGAQFREVFGRNIQKARLVARMRVSLAAVTEAEKSAVLAETDAASVEYAQRARLSLDQMAAALAECKGLVSAPSPDADIVKRLEAAFAEYRKANEEVLVLAVQNTNLKAQALSFDRATAALARMEQALAPYLDGLRGNAKTGRAAARALAEALRIQTLHAPHIMEKSEARMSEMEQRMVAADRLARASLAYLSGLGGADAAVPALAAYEDFQRITQEVLRLSRENTNVRSLVLTLDRKTKAQAMCEEALGALEEKVHTDMAKSTK